LRNIGGNTLLIMIFGSFFLLVSTCLTSLTCYGKEGAEWAAEPYKSAEAKNVAEDTGGSLSTFNRIIFVSILLMAAVIYAIYCLRTSSNTKDQQKMGKGRTFSKARFR
jgi:hypothetical protein